MRLQVGMVLDRWLRMVFTPSLSVANGSKRDLHRNRIKTFNNGSLGLGVGERRMHEVGLVDLPEFFGSDENVSAWRAIVGSGMRSLKTFSKSCGNSAKLRCLIVGSKLVTLWRVTATSRRPRCVLFSTLEGLTARPPRIALAAVRDQGERC